ncbi:MAG: bifunctional diaminohydroxyphosphoribosylaminopyrimidine deaminase/5-amino-6-(5-phosphoribosylamino)uracil reductase RibD [Candidatus Melainabacteria bacterium]|nr:bifunctional diaminohydroxyphosphoribosylaminopyrimidine deaminase/5-amino-6-(5-phosphoribosylamino)uracil reductase RibD [Candidatus Melainabacteria bacterium]
MYKNDVEETPVEYFMQECFTLAKIGLGRTSPNPVVGAIVLDKNGIPIGKGYHKKAGMLHAEVIAIKQAGELVKDGTLIVNLEPCCHVGKTPPCTDLIIKSQIKEVVFCNYDPNSQVNKQGEKKLIENNIKVISTVLEQEGLELNKFFFKWMKTKLPWVTLKQAQTLDGKIALINKESKWITEKPARQEVHKLRNIYDAVMVSASTIEVDNPKLTVRDINDSRNPLRIILDTNLTTSPGANVYKNNAEVILVTKSGHPKDKLNHYLKNNTKLNIIELSETNSGKLNLKELFFELGKKEILSVLVEAGPKLGGELIINNLIDEYILFISPKVFGDNSTISSLDFGQSQIKKIDEAYKFKLFNYKAIGNDFMLSLRTKI